MNETDITLKNYLHGVSDKLLVSYTVVNICMGIIMIISLILFPDSPEIAFLLHWMILMTILSYGIAGAVFLVGLNMKVSD